MLIREASEHPRPTEAVEMEANRIGREYADWASRRALPPGALLRILFQVRRAMIDAALDLSENKSLEPQAVGRILRQVHAVLEAVEMALVQADLSGPA